MAQCLKLNIIFVRQNLKKTHTAAELTACTQTIRFLAHLYTINIGQIIHHTVTIRLSILKNVHHTPINSRLHLQKNIDNICQYRHSKYCRSVYRASPNIALSVASFD